MAFQRGCTEYLGLPAAPLHTVCGAAFVQRAGADSFDVLSAVETEQGERTARTEILEVQINSAGTRMTI